VSHLSDICYNGAVFAVEFSLKNFQKLLALSKHRSNIIPISEDARNPERYQALVGVVDCIYQDISQRDQVSILHSNVERIENRGNIMLMLKARSIDVTSAPSKIFKSTGHELVEKGYHVLEQIELAPYQKDHVCYLMSNDEK